MSCRRIPWKLLLLGIVLGAPAVLALAQEGPPGEIKWRYDYNVARKEAQEKNLPLIIDFGTEDCYWCKQLDMRTFKSTKVVGVMNERFIPLKVDANKDVALTSALRISSFPTIVLAGPDGKILDTMVGFKEADPFHENLQRALAGFSVPDWMQTDFQKAQKWQLAGDYARAIATLRTIVEDGKSRPVQVNAQKLLKEIEAKAEERVARAKEMNDKGQVTEAIEHLTETIRVFAGADASRDASALLGKMAQMPDIRQQQKNKRAGELLAQARDFHKNREYLPCYDRCKLLIDNFGDLPEGREASLLVADLESNADWLQAAADALSDRLGGLYLSLADNHLKKGQPDRAEYYLRRVIAAFPGSRLAESAQIRLGQLQGTPARRVEIGAAAP